MTYYRIHLKSESILIIVGDDVVIQAPPMFSRFVGRPWAELNQAFEALDIIVEPLVPESKSDHIFFQDEHYEIKWNDNRTQIRRISKHREGRVYDIQFSSLPLLIRNALC